MYYLYTLSYLYYCFIIGLSTDTYTATVYTHHYFVIIKKLRSIKIVCTIQETKVNKLIAGLIKFLDKN